LPARQLLLLSGGLDHIHIGYGIMSTGGGEAHVVNLCISPLYRCRGIGSQLLEHLTDFAKGLGVVDVFLEVRPSNPAAIRLDQWQGFAQIGVRSGYYQAWTAVRMRLLRKSMGRGTR
jgi:ribosomal-protein-alanine N-acetyltransferase